MRLKIILFICCLFSCIIVTSQTSKKSARRYRQAVRYDAEKQTEKACKKMLAAIKKSPRSPDAYSRLGEWYFQQHKFNESANIFRRASARCTDGRKHFARPFARSLVYCGLTDSALQLINTYGTGKEAEWDKLRQQALFVKQAYLHISPQSPVNLGERVNSSSPELFPAIMNDTATLYFTRRVNNVDEDLYSAEYDSCGGWFYALNQGDPPNSPDQESAEYISADGHYMFFTRCENRSQDGWAEGGCDMFMAYRVTLISDWTIAQPFGSTINTTAYEGMPSLSPDNRQLFFVSDRPGGYGGYDIYISRFEDGLWQQPVNAGPNINTAGNETAPFVAVDNKTIYFTSDGWPGMGGTDLFMSHRTTDSTFAKAVNLGYPINTADDEKSECVTTDGTRIYFASDRQGPAGNFDLYECVLGNAQQPVPVSYIVGYVYDSISKDRLNYASIHVCNAATGDTIYQFQSNRGDGSFTMILPVGVKYAINTARIGFTELNDTLLFDRQYLGRSLERNAVMLPSNYVYIPPVNDSLIATLHFDVNRAELSDSDKMTIRNLLGPWLEQPAIEVLINGYTDNTGSPMLNEELSYKRAGIVAKQAIALGFEKQVVHAKGWGEAKMIAPNDTEEGQQKNRRVEIVIRR